MQIGFGRHLCVGWLGAVIMGAAIAPSATLAADTKTDANVPALTLTPEEIAERDGRKACKVRICAAFRLKKAGDDIACDVVKTWRKAWLDKYMTEAHVSWPWGKVRCTSKIKIQRQGILDAMTKPAFDFQLDPHKVACTVERKAGAAALSFTFQPKVRFENGKAVKATLNWGKVEAPTLIKGVMWTAKTTDNTFNVLQSSVVEDINEFISVRCDEVKADWAAR